MNIFLIPHAIPARALLAGLVLIAQASLSLFVHGLRHPGAPATMSRADGRVTPR